MDLFQKLQHLLADKDVVTIEEMCLATGRAGVTVKQALSKLEYLTSYNHNSRFYALVSKCRFDEDGIWKHPRASFTRHRTLTALLVALIDKSSSGCTSKDLETITGTPVTGVLPGMARKDLVVRGRWKRQFVYFTATTKRRRESQARARCGSAKVLSRREDRNMTADELKRHVVVLLEIIRSRPATIRELRENISQTHPEIPASVTNDVCRRYQVQLKKKIDRPDVFEVAVKLSLELRRLSGVSYVFHFAADCPWCPTCGSATDYFRTTPRRTVRTIRYGDVTFRESQVVCRAHRHDPEDGSPLNHGSSFGRSLGPAKSPIGFDVITEIGTRRFIGFRQLQEVVDDLQAVGITLSGSAVSRWADYFLAAVECLHYTKIHKLRHLVRRNGGYLLHIDATTETTSDTVFVCVDRLLGTVLLSERISSENRQEVKQQLLQLKRNIGVPLAIMRDMSDKLEGAVGDVFPGVPDRICHAHFLRDIGKDLMKEAHVRMGHRMAALKINADLQRMRRELQSALTAEEVREATARLSGPSGIEALSPSEVPKHHAVVALRLVRHVLSYNEDGEGLGFPFDLSRVHFFSRLNRLRLRLQRYSRRHPRGLDGSPYLERLNGIAARTLDEVLRDCTRRLRSMQDDFQRLRSVVRFEVKTNAPLAETMSIGTLKEVRAYNRQLVSYTKQLIAGQKRGTLTQAEKVILKHLVKYQFKLPIPEHLVEVLESLDRTNNFEEGIFRKCKRGQRRQAGKKDISREFSLHGPYLPLMLNLQNEHYVAALIGGIKDLPLRLSKLPSRDVDHYRRKLKESRRGKFFEELRRLDGINLLPGYL